MLYPLKERKMGTPGLSLSFDLNFTFTINSHVKLLPSLDLSVLIQSETIHKKLIKLKFDCKPLMSNSVNSRLLQQFWCMVGLSIHCYIPSANGMDRMLCGWNAHDMLMLTLCLKVDSAKRLKGTMVRIKLKH